MELSLSYTLLEPAGLERSLGLQVELRGNLLRPSAQGSQVSGTTVDRRDDTRRPFWPDIVVSSLLHRLPGNYYMLNDHFIPSKKICEWIKL